MNWISIAIQKGIPLLMEFFAGKRPTAEYLRKYPFVKTTKICQILVVACYLYTLDYAFAVAKELRRQKQLIESVNAKVVVANKQLADYRAIIADQKARYLHHKHLQPFYICDPDAGEDTLGECIK